MIGAMVAYTVIVALVGASTPLPPLAIVLIGALAAIPVCMAVGYTLERVAYRPLRRAPRLAPLITAIGLSIILQHLAMIIWSRNPLPYPQIVEIVSYHVTGNPDGATITNVQIAIIVDLGRDDGGADRARVPDEARHRDARDRAEPAGRRPDGHRHQPRDRAHVRHRRGARRGRGRDGRHLLRHRALPDGLPARPEGVLRRGAGRHRQPRRRDARRHAARADRGARRGLRRRSHQPVPSRSRGRRRSRKRCETDPNVVAVRLATTRTCSRSSC